MLLANLVLAATSSLSSPMIEAPAPAEIVHATVVASDEDTGWRWWKKSRKSKCKPSKTGSRPVPEPMTMSLLGLGGAGLALASRRRRRQPARG